MGPGFSREDLKALLLSQNAALTGPAVTSTEDIATRLLLAAGRIPKGQRPLASPARQEILRYLLGLPQISAHFEELKRLRRQTGFFKKLDRSIQAFRMAAAHEDEVRVYCERLDERAGANPVRREVLALAAAYEAWLQGQGLWDPPRLIREAADFLRENTSFDLLGGAQWPEEIVVLRAQTPESLERDFWDLLSQRVAVRVLGGSDATREEQTLPAMEWERWHTLDDAAERLAEHLAQVSRLSDEVVVMPDTPAVRRVLTRALRDWNVPVADPRDPTRLRWDENLKWMLLPLEMVATDFERSRVVSWIQGRAGRDSNIDLAWVDEINSRAIRRGLGRYSGAKLEKLHRALEGIRDQFGGRKTCQELAAAHLSWLVSESQPETVPLVSFFESFWASFEEDLDRLGLGERRAPILYWMDRVRSRLEESKPPNERLKPRDGVRIYRLGQAPVGASAHLWLFGLPASWLSGDGTGDYAFSEREREILATEFAVRSAIQVREERHSILKSWLGSAGQVTVLDSQYDWDGREKETLAPLFRELGVEPSPRDCGSHPRWTESFGAVRTAPPKNIHLGQKTTETPIEIRASEIDRYSRCPFQALGAYRWSARDLREPDGDLWPDVRGIILHDAVKTLLESRSDQGSFGISPAQALEKAWNAMGQRSPKGLFQEGRLPRIAREGLLKILEKFCEKEREYVQRAGTRIGSLEGPRLKLETSEFRFVGIPDRIDEHPDGLFLLDYKTSGSLAKGKEMVEQGYRLQLPLYALAAQRQLGRPAIGVQFIELNKKGARSSGIFLKAYDGKDPGKLTNNSRAVGSLFSETPDEIWSLCEEQILNQARAYCDGRFDPVPKKPEECRSCAYADLCGKRREGEPSG